ncbi:MAG: RNA polymerase sporulation sigma factor SigH [Lachnospiraceae bacterium]|nr:RNA polymerase sporulation sigma factor SigH [Lachnospiraceae bacterium]
MDRLEDLSEEAIIQRAQAQDNDAIDFLMKKYKSVVRKKTRTLFMIGGDRDDLIQEGMIGLFKAIRSFEPDKEASFATFAELCISRQLYSAIKSSNRLKNLPLNTYISIYSLAYSSEDGDSDGDFMLDKSLSSLEMSPEEILINRESAQNVKENLAECLSKMEKEVFELYLSGLTYQEIAQKMQKEPKAIDNALQRIKAKVNKEIHKYQ